MGKSMNWGGISRNVLIVFLFATGQTSAHDSWVSSGGYRSPIGEWCCGAGDCGVRVAGAVKAVLGGYEVDADFRIEGFPDQRNDGGKGQPYVEHVKEFVPYNQAQPSPDGEFWRCKRPDGSLRCFFAPPGDT